MKDYYRLRVKEIIKETEDAITIAFKQPFLGRIRYKCGQFITLIFEITGKEYRRAYSINSTPGIDDDISITVKKVPNGIISNYIFNDVKRGDSILIMKPMGNFTLESDKKKSRSIVLFGAGSGITPLLSILKSTLYFEPESTVTLLYSNRNEASIIFKEQLDILKERFADKLFVEHLLTDKNNRFDPEKLDQYLTINPFFLHDKASFYMCGPDAYMESIKDSLLRSGFSEDIINYESFTPKKESVESDFQVVYKSKKSENLVNVKAGKSLLDAGLEGGVRMRFACFNGQCGTCKSKCQTGSVKMAVDSILTPEEKNEGYILTCVSYPDSENVIIELD